MLINADNILNYARNYRVVFVDGRYGSGKTSFAFILAYALCQKFGFRYILSNVSSVWATPLDEVVLRDDRYLDAVFVLDEGGLYLDAPGAAKQWLAYLRKLNIVLIIPSVYPPSTALQKLTVQRLYNLGVFGVPVWWYGVFLRSGRNRADDRFFWWQPSEVFGIYDTEGMPQEAEDHLVALKKWTKQAQKVMGYSKALVDAPPGALDGSYVSSSGLSIVDASQVAIDDRNAQLELYEQIQEVSMMTSLAREEMDNVSSQIKRIRR